MKNVPVIDKGMCASSAKDAKFLLGGKVSKLCNALSGPLNRLNAVLSLLHPLDCYRTALCAIGSAIDWPYLALSGISTHTVF